MDLKHTRLFGLRITSRRKTLDCVQGRCLCKVASVYHNCDMHAAFAFLSLHCSNSNIWVIKSFVVNAEIRRHSDCQQARAILV